MPDTLTWAILLGRWKDFAAASLALPEKGEQGRWKQAVAHVISLQALTHALGEIGELDLPDIPLAIDRAAIAVRDDIAAMNSIWRNEPLPTEAAEICNDAETALQLAQSIGVEWSVAASELKANHPGELAIALAEAEIVDVLLLPTPGVSLYQSTPCAHFMPANWDEELVGEMVGIVEDFLGASGECGPGLLRPQRQVYRQFDFSRGGPVSDLVVPTAFGLVSGQPILVPAIADGQVCPVTLPPRRQEQIDPLPVQFVESEGDLTEHTA